MASSKKDAHKRKFAQALNHLANAIVDIHEVYGAFDETITRMRDVDIENATNDNAEHIKRYEVYKETLKQMMMYMAVPREQMLEFIKVAYNLDEESIKVYLG